MSVSAGSGCQADREVLGIECGDGRGIADHGGDRLAGEASPVDGKDRLVAERRDDAMDVVAGDVGGRQHPDQPGIPGEQRRQIADGKRRRGVRRAHHRQPQRIDWRHVVTETLAAVDAGEAVDTPGPRADDPVAARLGHVGIEAVRLDHGSDDLAIAGAAAEHAAQGILGLRLAGLRHPLDQRGCRQQHARRADAALGSAVVLERLLQSAQRAVGQTLDGGDRPAGGLTDRGQAGAHRDAVDQDGAGTAVAGIAADLGAGEPQVLAQHLRQSPHRRRLDRHRPTIQGHLPGWKLQGGQLHGDIVLQASRSSRSVNARPIRVRAASRR